MQIKCSLWISSGSPEAATSGPEEGQPSRVRSISGCGKEKGSPVRSTLWQSVDSNSEMAAQSGQRTTEKKKRGVKLQGAES